MDGNTVMTHTGFDSDTVVEILDDSLEIDAAGHAINVFIIDKPLYDADVNSSDASRALRTSDAET